MSSQLNSIYIPRVSKVHTEESIRYIMDVSRVGMVTRVDFTPINKSKGFQKVVEPGAFRSAFVHFTTTWQHPTYTHVVWEGIRNDVPHQLVVSKDEYWICMKNKSPIQSTHMNIHQVVDNCAYLEKQLIAQTSETETLKEQVTELKLEIGHLKDAIQAIKDIIEFDELREATQGRTRTQTCV